MKRLTTLTVLFILLSFHAFSQNWLWVDPARCYTNGAPQEGSSAAMDSWDNLYVTGTFEGTIGFATYLFSTSTADVFIAKFDTSGNYLWAAASQSTGGGSCWGYGAATDKANNVYVTGTFMSSTAFKPYSLSSKGSDAFLVKYNFGGGVLWAKQSVISTSSGIAEAGAVTTDNAGNIYVTGNFNATTNFGTHVLTATQYSVFLVKYSPSGNVIWAKQSVCLTTGSAYGGSITSDGKGNIYVAGRFTDSLSFGGSILKSANGLLNTFLVKYDTAGNVLWAKQATCTGTATSSGYSVVTDKAGYPYITGQYKGITRFDNFQLTTTYGAPFLVKYTPGGNVVWAHSGIVLDKNDWYGYSLAADTSNNIYLTAGGGFSLCQIKFGSDTFTSGGSDPAVIARFDTAGNISCGAAISSSGDDICTVSSDPTGKYVYLSGDIISPVTFSGITLNQNCSTEYAFSARWNPCPAPLDANTSTSGTGCKNQCNGTASAHPSGGTPPYAYLWNTTPAQTTQTATGLCQGIYTVTITDATSNTVVKADTVKARSLTENTCCDTIIASGQSALLQVTPYLANYTYTWVPPDGLSCDSCPATLASPTATTTYSVTISNDSGCSVSEYVTVDVGCGTVFVPNAFSPNGDGHNDILYVRGDCIKTIDFSIYDRWGEKIFESYNISNGWDGTWNGKQLNTGTYAYSLHAILFDGKTVTEKGSIALVR